MLYFRWRVVLVSLFICTFAPAKSGIALAKGYQYTEKERFKVNKTDS